MGGAITCLEKHKIIVNGLVKNPLSVTISQLKNCPPKTITAFHECYGSPLKPPTTNGWRIGNVKWTGIPLKSLLEIAKPFREAKFIWSDGLDYVSFGGVATDRYQKDLPISKVMSDEVLLAYEINGETLDRKRRRTSKIDCSRWFGTNSTKWLCKISVQAERAKGPYTTRFYNEVDSLGDGRAMRPIWRVEVNSMIVCPENGEKVKAGEVEIWGWA